MKKLIKALLGSLLSILPKPQHPSVAGSNGLFINWRIGFIKGWVVRPVWKLKEFFGGPKIQVGKGFSLQGKLICTGPGTVIFGDHCTVFMTTTPFTHSPQAVIRIGNFVGLNGTRFGCEKEITIGDYCILADCRIMDTDFHAVHKNRIQPGATAIIKPVRIENNVWIAAGAAVLKGVTIGRDSVIAFGSVVVRDIAPGMIAGGNPAKEIAAVPEN